MNRMACSEVGGDESVLRLHVFAAHSRLCVEPQPPPSAACYPGEAAPVQRPRFLRRGRRGRARGLKLEPPGLQLRWRDAELGSHTVVAPGSDSRATDCSLYSGENRRLVCFVISSLQVGIQFTAWSGIREQLTRRARAHGRQWRRRFLKERIEGLSDEPRPGRPRTLTDEQVAEVIERTLETTRPTSSS